MAMMEGKFFFIYAGSQQQARYVADWLGIHEHNWRYIVRGDELVGRHYPLVILYGSWYERPRDEKDRIRTALMMTEAKIMRMDDHQ